MNTTGNTPSLRLRPATEADLELFFEFQTDDEATYMAAFTPENPHDREAYLTKWKRLLNANPTNLQAIVLSDGTIAGSVLTYEMFGEPQVSYWIEKKHWGSGIATEALTQFLKIIQQRPIFGRVATDNVGSKRVLEKCGFKLTGLGRGYANARKAEIEEYVFKLD